MATFLQMRQNLLLLTMGGLGKALQPGDAYDLLVNRALDDLWEDFEWSFRYTNCIINTSAPKTVGAITVTQGRPEVIGNGTAFGLADRGAFLWVGGVGQTPLPIADVQGPTLLTLTSPFAGPTLVATSYQLAPLYYRIPGAQEVLGARSGNIDLQKRLREEINVIDPCRVDIGGAPAYVWCPAPTAADGSEQIEMWPTPSDARAYLIDYYRRAPHLENDGDVPMLSSTLVEEKATITACEMMYASTGQQSWMTLRNLHALNLYGDGGTQLGKLDEQRDRDKSRQQYRGRIMKPNSPLQAGAYDAGFTPLHSTPFE